MQRWRAIAAVPALALTAVVFFNPGVIEALESLSTAKVTNYVAIMQRNRLPLRLPSLNSRLLHCRHSRAKVTMECIVRLKLCRNMRGGEAALMKFIASNLKWIPGGKTADSSCSL